MAIIRPFKAIRPTRDKVHLVASRSYVSYNKRQLDAKLSTNPYTYIHIINPEWGERSRTKPNSKARFQKIKNKFDQFHSMGIFQQDENPCIYVYRQQTTTHQFTGIIACTSIEDYFSGVIKKHEKTLAKREIIFKEYLGTTRVNAEPVLLTYAENHAVESHINKVMQNRPEYDFTTADKVRHQLWIIDNKQIIASMEAEFATINSIYIADGHHRCASSALMGKQLAEENPNHDADEHYNFFMSLLVPDTQLKIWDYNRLVKDLNGHSETEFLDQVELNFNLTQVSEAQPVKSPNSFSMYLANKWYKVQARAEQPKLDSELLSNEILKPLLGIKDLRTDKRVSFIGGNEGPEGIKSKVDSGKFAVGFGLYPVSVRQLQAIADAEQTMPPKSTWVEPKLRSGLTIHRF